MPKLVRLYPHNPRRGWFVQTYLDPGLGERKGGMKFVGKRGWYQVTDDVAAELEDVLQKQGDPRSGPAFLIAKDAKHAKVLDAELVDPEDEDVSIGTADSPVQSSRPGKRKGKPRTRTKKVKAPTEPAAETAD